MHITPLYASLLALLFVALSVRALRLRKTLRIVIGDSGNPAMLRAMRVHSNFAEYVPLGLILISMVELQAAAPLVVHGLGVALLAGRLSHAWGVSQVRENFAFRIFGMAMTLGTIIVCAAFLLWAFVVG
jgi:uncharacterized membrane protein YecN with MAPEG domain